MKIGILKSVCIPIFTWFMAFLLGLAGFIHISSIKPVSAALHSTEFIRINMPESKADRLKGGNDLPDSGLTLIKTSDCGTDGIAPGESIKYTISASNTGTAEQQNIALTDTLPAGTTFTAGSGMMVVNRSALDYSDTFDIVAYSQSSGMNDWSGESWIETNDNLDPKGGYIYISNGQLRIGRISSSSISRRVPVNLTNRTVFLTIDAFTNNFESNDSFFIDISKDGGSTWSNGVITKHVIPSGTILSQDISNYVGENTVFRMRISVNDNGESIYINSVSITSAAATQTSTFTGLPSIITLADHFSLSENDSFAATYQVTVDNPVTVSGLDQITNTAVISSDQQGALEATVVDLLQSSSVDVSLHKTVDAITPNVGDKVAFSLEISNTEGNTATNIQVTDLLPNGYTYDAGSIRGGSERSDIDPAGNADIDPTNDGLSWTIDSLEPGTSVSLTYDATVNPAGTGIGYDNYAEITALSETDIDSTPGNGRQVKDEDDDDSVSLIPNGILTGHVYADIDGDGTQDAEDINLVNVSLLITTSTGSTFTVVTDSNGNWNVNVPAGITAVDVQETGASFFDYYPAGYTHVEGTDPQLSTAISGMTVDSGSDGYTAALADLSLTQVVDDPFPGLGKDIIVLLTMNNAGPRTVTGVLVKDVLPSGITYVSDNGSGAYASGTGIWTISSLAAGTSKQLAITASVTAINEVNNTAEIFLSSEADPDSTPDNQIISEDDFATVTITPQYGTITVINTIIPEGSIQLFSFSTNTSQYSGFSLAGGETNHQDLPAGTYSVTETHVTGWASSSACVSSLSEPETTQSVELKAGEQVVCTFTNLMDQSVSTMDATYTLTEDSSLTIDSEKGVLSGDAFPDGFGSLNVSSDVSNGTLTLNNDGSFIYIPNANFNGKDGFTYRLCDRDPEELQPNECAEGRVTLTISPADDLVNAVDKEYSMEEGSTLFVAAKDGLFAGNEYPDGLGSLSIKTDVSDGVLKLDAATGAFEYSPDHTIDGDVNFSYQICDLDGDCSSAGVVVHITPVATMGLSENIVSVVESTAKPGSWDITIEFLVKNYRAIDIANIQVSDDLSLTFPPPAVYTITSLTSDVFSVNKADSGEILYLGTAASSNLLSGKDTLTANMQGTILLTINLIPAQNTYENTAVLTGNTPKLNGVSDTSQNGTDPDNSNSVENPEYDLDGKPGNNSDPTQILFNDNIINPPAGVMKVDDSKLPAILWKMVWFNTPNFLAVDAIVSDPIPEGAEYWEFSGLESKVDLPAGAVPGSTNYGVSCSSGTSITTSTIACYYEPYYAGSPYPRGRIVWQGSLGSDYGITDTEAAGNAIEIAFFVKNDESTTHLENKASIAADLNLDGDLEEEGEQEAASIMKTWGTVVGGDTVAPSTAETTTAPASASIETSLRKSASQFSSLMIPVTGFAPNRITALPEQPLNLRYSDSRISLEIPSLDVYAPILGVPQNQTTGQWDVSWLWNQVGWLNGTAYPGGSGNAILTAHVSLSSGEAGPFVNLNQLQWGDRVLLHSQGQVYAYEVREVKRVIPTDPSVFAHEEKSWLTLVTCQGYDEKTGAYLYRTAVRAVLISVDKE